MKVQLRSLARLDMVVAAGLAATTAVVVSYFAPRGFNGGFVDMAHDGYQLRQALDLSAGATLFRDTFDQYGPLGPYMNQLGFLILGRRLLSIKYFLAAWYGLTALVLYVLAREFLGVALSVAAVLLWLLTAPFYQHGVMISPHAYAVFFQVVALVLLLRAGYRQGKDNDAAFWLVGVMCGMAWLLKQSLGSLFFVGVGGYLISSAFLGRWPWRTAITHVGRVSGGTLAVVGPAMLLLASVGAIEDWYRQTIEFPRSFYLQTGGLSTAEGGVLISTLAAFVEAQLTAEPFWLLLRGLIFCGGIAAVVRGQDHRLWLAFWVTGALWLAAFPSANYMHQWWTLSPTIVAAVFVIDAPLRFSLPQWPRRIPVAAGTMAILIAIAWSPVSARFRDASARDAELARSLSEPRVLAGIRTDAVTKQALDTLHALAAAARAHNGATSIVSIDSSDGYRTGVAHTLPLLSFYEDNVHPAPVYWSLPVLTTQVYPQYADTVSAFIREHSPLIVDYRRDTDSVRGVAGYVIQASVPLPTGRLIVYRPDDASAEWAASVPVLELGAGGEELVVNSATINAVLTRQLATASPEPLSQFYAKVPRYERLVGTLQKYGFHWLDLQDALRADVVREHAMRVLDDYALLRDAGVEHTLLLQRISPEVQAVVNLCVETETPLPDQLAPVVDALIESGSLRGPSGEVLPGRDAITELIEQHRAARGADAQYIVDSVTGLRRRAMVYRWPPKAAADDRGQNVTPLDSSDVVSMATIVTNDGGRWQVRGPIDAPMSYLLKFKSKRLAGGARFSASGVLIRGGLTIGLIRDDAWVGFVNVTAPGAFIAGLTAPGEGDYDLVVANNVPSRSWLTALAAATPLRTWLPSLQPWNEFRFERFGWVQEEAPPAPGTNAK